MGNSMDILTSLDLNNLPESVNIEAPKQKRAPHLMRDISTIKLRKEFIPARKSVQKPVQKHESNEDRLRRKYNWSPSEDDFFYCPMDECPKTLFGEEPKAFKDAHDLLDHIETKHEEPERCPHCNEPIAF